MTPAATASPFTKDQLEKLKSWTTHYPYPIMGLLEALREVQEWFHCILPEHEAPIAELFGTTTTRVHEVATFFPMFTPEKAGRTRIGVCHGLSCAMAGAAKVCHSLEQKLGVREGETSADGEYLLEELECIGACDFAPAFQVNDELQGKASDEALSKVLRK